MLWLPRDGQCQERSLAGKFDFHINTYCGYLEMDNTWKDSWPVSLISILIHVVFA